MPRKQLKILGFKEFLLSLGSGVSEYFLEERHVIYNQGDLADSVFYVSGGQIKLVAFSISGKEAIIGISNAGQFFGEGCLIAGHSRRASDAVAIGPATILRIEKALVIRLLREDDIFSGSFLAHLLARSKRIEEDLIDQLFNSSEKRLARTLLLLANFDTDDDLTAVIPRLSQASLAQMVGASRPRVSQFLNKFRDLGFIEYDGEIRVHRSLGKILQKD
ncbi:Crp/Fnr family transcriptional regulator [Methylobacterium sp. 77]|uniref:Crp/Fnr family transcriptional regulator n=1 Tax=Methylobacterium sp. 77 TaxID=1101192 RepID=UPI00047E2654|nr:Crp/Fnr family transcriptional regulator [Methylobacterium sp. 77]